MRVGLHTGTPVVTEEGYVGPDVHRAARIAAAGHGGQVLVSAATASLVEGGLRDLGEHRFKDLAAPERVFQLGEAEFPPLKSLYRTNLPVPSNPLVGRKKELVDVLRVVAHDGARVVTVTGPGGVGKTRFALGAAAELAEHYPDGTWFVDLSPLRDPALVLPAIAHAAQIQKATSPATSPTRRVLLLLDNFEHVVGAAADVAVLVASCPRLTFLVTSREPLRIGAEREYALQPLAESPAVELFRQRVAIVAPEAEVDYAVAAEICRQLDGLPLAIELGAARSKILEPEALLSRLERRLPVLVTRARDLPERQRTLHAAIAWSYELLDEDEQRLFRSLAVFRGGATLEAIEAVTDAASELVESLVDKSLLRRRFGRFVMLETIREFAQEEMDASEDSDAVRRRHAEYFAELAVGAYLNAADLRLGAQRLDVAGAEHDNFRAALAWALDADEIELGLRIATGIELLWTSTAPREGMRWFAALLERADGAPDDVLAHALRAYGSATDIAGHDDDARTLYERSLGLFERLADEEGQAILLHRLAIQAMRRGDLERARQLVAESEAIHERTENPWGITQTVGTLGAIERDAGNLDRAHELVAESAELAAEIGFRWWHAGMLVELAMLSLAAGRVDEADSGAREALAMTRELRDYGTQVFGVGILACVAAEHGQVVRAGRLWGAVEVEHVGAPLGGWLRHRADAAARIRRVSGHELDVAVASGRNLSLDEAVELALADA